MHQNLLKLMNHWKERNSKYDTTEYFENRVKYWDREGTITEGLLQAYLYLHKEDIFPMCRDFTTLGRSNLGKLHQLWNL